MTRGRQPRGSGPRLVWSAGSGKAGRRRPNRASRGVIPLLLLAIAGGAGAGTVWGVATEDPTGEVAGATNAAASDGGFACTVASVTDGDTLRCEEAGADGRAIRVRLSGIAARERDGSCSPGHPCPDASAEAATSALRRLAEGEVLRCTPDGETYGRVAAFCSTQRGLDLSCAMVESGTAARWDRYWGAHAC